MERRLFPHLQTDSQRPAGVTKGQNELFDAIVTLAGSSDTWTGPRSMLAKACGCSTDTVTRRKDRLVELGLLSVIPSGRHLAYTVIRTAVITATAEPVRPVVSARRETKPTRRWWKRPDANQLDLFDGPTTRAEAAAALAATTMHWIGLLVSVVLGPAARSAAPAAKRTGRPAATAAIVREFEPQPAAPAARPAATATESAAESQAPAAERPHTIEPLTIKPLTTSTPAQLSSPITTIEPLVNGSSKFCLWKDAKKSDFDDPKRLQEVFERHHQAGLSTHEQREDVIACVLSIIRLAKPKQSLPGLITKVLRGDPATTKFGPWITRGNQADRERARSIMRAIDVPAELQIRTSNLEETNEFENTRRSSIAALKARYRS